MYSKSGETVTIQTVASMRSIYGSLPCAELSWRTTSLITVHTSAIARTLLSDFPFWNADGCAIDPERMCQLGLQHSFTFQMQQKHTI